jgi:hypothetical protein
MIGMQGAIQAERGFARAWSAGASPGVKAAYMESAAMKGALAAEQIRNRYYKKEWEQIHSTRLQPLHDRLAAAQEARNLAMRTTVMPVRRVVTPEEYQQRADLLGQGGPPQLQTVPGKTTKDGTQTQEVVPQQAAAPNQALGQMMGAVEAEESLALFDPVSSEPVPFASARGIEIWQNADNDFWGEYKAVNTEMADILGEYTGNPFADKAISLLQENAIKQSNIAATGQTDPRKAQEWWEGRMKFEADQETAQLDQEAGALSLRRAQAALQTEVMDAARLAETDPAFRDLVGDKIADKLIKGEKLTQNQMDQAASATRYHRQLQEKAIAQRAKQRVFTIPTTNVTNPSNWGADMMADPVYQTYYKQEFAQAANSVQEELLALPEAEMVNVLRSAGADDNMVIKALEGLWNDPGVTTVIERIAQSKGLAQTANDSAFLRRLPELERQQPELRPVVDGTLDQYISQLRGAGYDLDGEDEARIRAERYIPFLVYPVLPGHLR